jgi:hypothetical protein
MVSAFHAPGTQTASFLGLTDHPLPHRKSLDPVSQNGYFTAPFMAKDERKLRRKNPLQISSHDMDVGPTDAARSDAAKNLLRSNLRSLKFPIPQIIPSIQDGCLHFFRNSRCHFLLSISPLWSAASFLL